MIPRFIIRGGKHLAPELLALGYTLGVSELPEDLLLLGSHILQAPPKESNPLIKVYRVPLDQDTDILRQASLQLQWNLSKKATVTVGSKQIEVLVTPLGVLIDNHIIPIGPFMDFQLQVQNLHLEGIASHTPLIKKNVFFMTIGCAEYSLEDLDKILSAYVKLTTPTQ